MAAPAAVRFAFDEVTHRYTVDGQTIPSVTQVLRAAGLVDYGDIPEPVLKYAAERSVAVHLACEYFDQDDLDPDSLDPEVMPYVAAWRSFRLRYPGDILACEQRHLGNLNGFHYGMTLDRLVNFVTHKRERLAILDIKCTRKIHPWNGVQLAGYAIGMTTSGTVAKRLSHYRRLLVQLKPDATYQLHECEDANDGEVFAAALRIAHWKISNRGDPGYAG